jgi:hypothetical protein
VTSSSDHDALVELFRDRPAFAGELLRMLAPSVKLGSRALARARVASQSFEQIQPTTYTADLVVTFGGVKPRVALIIEVQRQRSKRKRGSWPLYIAHLRARYGCPVFLLVLAPSASVARWCAEAIPLGHPEFVLKPIVAGPESVPRVHGPKEALRRPELAVLSAIVHARSPEAFDLALVAAEAVLSRGPDSSYLYYDLIVSALRAKDARRLENRMTQHRQFASRHLQRAYLEGVEKGVERGSADAILKVLAARGLDVTAKLEQRIRDCHDLATLDRWLEQAATASSVDDLTD